MTKTRLFRWKAILPFVLFVALVGIVWLLFGENFLRRSAEDYATETLGTEVDIGSLKISESRARLTLGALQVADPFHPTRNLVEAGRIVLQIDPVPLLEKKFVIDQMDLTGLRFGTTRSSPARPVKTGGIAQRVRAQVSDWKKQLDVPVLSLAPIDTLKTLALDPTKLGTVQAAQSVIQRGDSVRQALEASLKTLQPRPILDSASALATRLAATNPATLDLQSTAQTVAGVRKSIDQIDQLKKQLGDLQRSANAGVNLLHNGLGEIDAARQKDYQFARGLLRLPSISAPDISQMLFGPPTASVFEQALYYANLGRSYLPPGMDPLRRPGSRRVRMSGTSVSFPRERTWPTFLLRQGKIGFSLGPDTSGGSFGATVQGLTSEPAVYGKPTLFSAQGALKGANPVSVEVGGALNHVGSVPRDSLRAALAGLPLPSFDLPGLPFRLVPGRGQASLSFGLEGDRLRGHWSLRSDQLAAPASDSARGRPLTQLESIVGRVLGGVKSLSLDAELGGTVSHPSLAISSNVGDAIAGGIKAVIGEEVGRVEAKVRAEVDRQVGRAVDEAQKAVAGVQKDVADQIGGQSEQVSQVEAQLQAQLKRYTGGAGGLIKLPKF
jgi:uncharacterized protein (TIGR03545 family)